MAVFTEFVESVLDIVEDNKGNGGCMRVRGRFQAADIKNANGRIYPGELWERVLKEDRVSNMIRSRRMLGCVEHPSSGQTHLSNVSHIITGLHRKGNEIIGEAEILNTPSGLIIQELLRRKVPVGISSRGKGTSAVRNGVEYVNPDDFILESFDFVYKPSTPEAFPQLQESVLEGSPFDPNTPMSAKLDTIKKYDVRAGEIAESASSLKVADLHKLLTECQQMRSSLPDIVSALEESEADKQKEYVDSVAAKLESAHESLVATLDKQYAKSDLSRRVDTAINKEGSSQESLLRDLLAESRQENDYLRSRLDDMSSLLEADESGIVRRYNASTALAHETLGRLQEAMSALAEISAEYEDLQERYEAAVKLVAGFTESQQEGNLALTLQEAVEQFPGLTKFEKILRSCKTEDELVERVNDLIEAEGLNKSKPKPSLVENAARLSFAAAINEDGGAPDANEVVSESVLPKRNKKAAKDSRRVSGEQVLQESEVNGGSQDAGLSILEGLLDTIGGQ